MNNSRLRANFRYLILSTDEFSGFKGREQERQLNIIALTISVFLHISVRLFAAAKIRKIIGLENYFSLLMLILCSISKTFRIFAT